MLMGKIREIFASDELSRFRRGCFGLAALGAIVVLGTNASGAKGETRVLVDSYADEDYLKGKEADDALKRETYHFVEGKFHGGNMRDPSLREVSFMDVAESLAAELRKRNYYPAQTQEGGDLLIVVHRGMTQIEADWDELFPQDDLDDDSFSDSEEEDGTEESPGTILDETGYTYREQDNAELIGFDRALKRSSLNVQEGFELQDMLRSERYFLVLMAFDLRILRETGEKKLVWSTRFSLDAIQTNFEDAHFALSRGAANYFGTNLDGKLGKTTTHLGSGEVETGELKVIETLDDEEE